MQASSSYFRSGDDVEVLSNEKWSFGAWFPARILKVPVVPTLTLRNGKSFDMYKVEYKNLDAKRDSAKLLVGNTPLSYLRPQPPEDNAEDTRFEQNDVVDAFDRDMWWPGVVMNVVGDNKYSVGFKNPLDFGVYDRNELRSSWNWANGVWTRASKKVMRVPHFTPGETVEVNLNKEIDELWYSCLPVLFMGQLEDNLFLATYSYKSPDNESENVIVKEVVMEHQIRPLPPTQEDNVFERMDIVDAYADMGWWTGLLTEITEDNYFVKIRITGEEKKFSHSQLRSHFEWTNDKQWKKVSQCDATFLSTTSSLKLKVGSSNKRKGRTNVEKTGSSSRKSRARHSDGSSTSFRAPIYPSLKDHGQGKGGKNYEKPKEPSSNPTEESPSLLFDENSRVWTYFDSSHIFEKFPQRPHFKPLENVREVLREGKALKLMGIFECLVEKLPKLQVDDSEDLTDMYPQVNKLELNGFDVKSIRDRLSILKDMKVRFEQFQKFQNERKEVETILSGFVKETEELDKKIDNLRSEKEATLSKIGMWRLKLKKIEENSESLRFQFGEESRESNH